MKYLLIATFTQYDPDTRKVEVALRSVGFVKSVKEAIALACDDLGNDALVFADNIYGEEPETKDEQNDKQFWIENYVADMEVEDISDADFVDLKPGEGKEIARATSESYYYQDTHLYGLIKIGGK